MRDTAINSARRAEVSGACLTHCDICCALLRMSSPVANYTSIGLCA